MPGEDIEAGSVDSFYESRNDGQPQQNEGACCDEVIRHRARIEDSLSGQRHSHSQREPQDDVLKHCNTENQSGEACMENFQVGKDLRNNRDGSHRDTDGKDDDERDPVAVWTGQSRGD
jgi:hypothetical protein